MQPPFTEAQFLDAFRRYNQAVEPALWPLMLLALVVAGAALRGTTRSMRVAFALLGLLWLWTAIAYHLAFFATLGTVGYLFGALFALQALLFLRLAAASRPPAPGAPSGARGAAALLLVLYALVGYPLVGMAWGHRFPASATFGTPCPTTIFTFGILLLAAPVPRTTLVIPALWSVIGSTAVLSFGMREDVGLGLAALLALPLLLGSAARSARGREALPATSRAAVREPRSRATRIARAVAVVVVVLVAPYLAYVSAAWLRFGHPVVPAATREMQPMDRYMPTYEVREVHETRVAAPPAAAFAAACAFDLGESRAVRAVFRARELVMLRRAATERVAQPFLHEAMDLGWGMLAAAPPPARELVFGAVTRPWEGDVHFRALPATEFAAFDEPGYAKIVWSISVEPDGAGESIVRTETRVVTTDPVSRARFRRYWALVAPGVSLIRHQALALLKRDAERPAELARASEPIALAPDTAPRRRAGGPHHWSTP